MRDLRTQPLVSPQTGIANGQRGRNTQPVFGTVVRSGGRPGSACAASMSPTMRGVAWISARVYG